MGFLSLFSSFMYKGSYNVEVTVADSEPAESALRRFRKSVLNSGVLPEVKRRRYFENTQDIKKRKQSARFKKVFRPRVTDASDNIALGKPKVPTGTATPTTPAP